MAAMRGLTRALGAARLSTVEAFGLGLTRGGLVTPCTGDSHATFPSPSLEVSGIGTEKQKAGLGFAGPGRPFLAGTTNIPANDSRKTTYAPTAFIKARMLASDKAATVHDFVMSKTF